MATREDARHGLVSRPEKGERPVPFPGYGTILALRIENVALNLENTTYLGYLLALSKKTNNGLCWCRSNYPEHEILCIEMRKHFQAHVDAGRLCRVCWQPLATSDKEVGKRVHDSCNEPIVFVDQDEDCTRQGESTAILTPSGIRIREQCLGQ